MKLLNLGMLSLLLALSTAGCGGGGGGDSIPSGSTSGGNGNSGGNANNAILSGRFALMSATVGQNAHAVTSGVLTFDGNGGVSAGTTTTFNYSNSNVVSVPSVVIGGAYSIDGNRNLTGQITTTGGGTTTVTTATNGRVSTNRVYAGANFQDNFGNAGVFALIKPTQNGSNASLFGTFRFSAAMVGTLQGFEFGTVTFNGAGGINPGDTIAFSNGQHAQVTGGTYTVNSDGTLTGAVALNNGSTATLQGFVGDDRTVGVVIQDQAGNLGLGIGSPPPTTTSSNADLNGTGCFLALRTSPIPGGFITGTASFDGNGGIAANNVLTLSDGLTETITGGSYNINPDGTFSSLTVNTSLWGGVVTTASFLTLGYDKTSVSGVITDSLGEQGMVLFVK